MIFITFSNTYIFVRKNEHTQNTRHTTKKEKMMEIKKKRGNTI